MTKVALICDCSAHGFVSLTRGYVALFSPEDLAIVAERPWFIKMNKGGAYAAAAFREPGAYRTRVMHRVIMPDWPKVDHANRDRLDNQRHNLRQCSDQQNSRNRKARCNSATGLKGVSFHKATGKWRAVIYAEKQVSLGLFASPQQAAKAYDAAAIRMFGDFAATNMALGLLEEA